MAGKKKTPKKRQVAMGGRGKKREKKKGRA